MKTTVNNSYLYAFYKSGYFIPFLLFSILSLANNCLFFLKNFVEYDWRYFYALWGGFSHDLFFFSLTTLILALICKSLPKLKVFSLLVLYLLLCLPIFDYFYFKATLERFNWVVLQFINSHSARGYIGNMGSGLAYLIGVLFLFVFCFGLSCRKDKFAESYSFKFVGAIVIFFFFASLFTDKIVFSIKTFSKDRDTEVVFTGHMKTVEGKNRILENLSSGAISGFAPKKMINREKDLFEEYTDKEKKLLETNGVLPVHITNNKNAVFNKVIMIVLESFALEYIHAINPDIPVESSLYFDYLIRNYPHLNNCFTSDFPSLQGFNAILSSKIPFDENKHTRQTYNLASLFETKYPNTTWFLRGSSRVYGNEEIAVKNVFGFSNLIGYEDLTQKYNEPIGFTWGFLDDVLYDKAFNILKNNSNRILMVVKLLNQHQPAFPDLVKANYMPEAVTNHYSDIIKIVYDADKQLKSFIERCEKNNIIDDKTLVVITSDHYPPLGYGHTDLIKSEYQFQLGKLPLIFYTKQKEVFKNLDKDMLCCQLDIAPTLCELLGFDIPKEYMGQSLLSENFKPRSIGILNNERIFFQSEKLNFSESLIKPATETVVIRKWINNLLAN
jgi:hypothetical protein